MNQRMEISPAQLAGWLETCRLLLEGGCGYREAVERAVPEPWQQIVLCLLISGYQEIWEWAAKQKIDGP